MEVVARKIKKLGFVDAQQRPQKLAGQPNKTSFLIED